MSLLNTEHLATLGVIAASTAALVFTARLRPGAWTVTACRALALVIVVNEASWWVWLAFQHTWSASYALPLQLCDVVAFVSAAALWFRVPLLVELTYFWGLAGTSNALISPDLPDHFPSYLFLQYFVAHGAIVAAALLLVVGLRIVPRKGAVLRMVAVTLALVVLDAAVNAVTGGNYMYLRHTPEVPNLLDLMGPWPVYIISAAGLALLLFIALDLPFAIRRRTVATPSARAIEVPR
jgi:hypothetical integral membrane protein (TIGR02206 family)